MIADNYILTSDKDRTAGDNIVKRNLGMPATRIFRDEILNTTELQHPPLGGWGSCLKKCRNNPQYF